MADIAQTFALNPYAAEAAKIERMNRYAELLQSQGLAPEQKFSYAGIEARPSAAGALAKGLQLGMSGYLQGRGMSKIDQLSEKAQAESKEFIDKISGAPGEVAATPADYADRQVVGGKYDPEAPRQKLATALSGNIPVLGGMGDVVPGSAPLSGQALSKALLSGATSGNPLIAPLASSLYAKEMETTKLAPGEAVFRSGQRLFGLPPKDESPSEVKEYEFAVRQGFDGSFTDFLTQKRRAGATVVTVGGDSQTDAALRKKLSEKEGERWSELKSAGLVSAGLGQDFEALDQIMTVAPQGPLTGRLAEAFPGFSSAGDAFQSIVTRVAPTLRTPGSGSTSDIEYEGMLNSLPRLKFKPEANRVIGDMMKAKAALNVERSRIITAYENEDLTASEARRALASLDKKSIMSPALRDAIKGLNPGATAAQLAPDDAAALKWAQENPNNPKSADILRGLGR